jgi:LysR family transcriptional regulator, hydrogen peroxide-inducible genes activator
MEFHQLRYFTAVAETGSFTKGASREHVSQPSLSQQIGKLEEEVGTQLFVRLGHSIKLTPAGKAFLPKAKSILNQISTAANEMQIVARAETGSVTIGAISTAGPYLLPKVIRTFRRKHPWVHLQVVEGYSPDLLALLRNAEVDMVLTQHPTNGKEFRCVELIHDSLYLVCPNTHRFSKRKSVSLTELGKEPFLLLAEGLEFRKRILTALRKARVRPNIVYEALDFYAITAMVGAGLGVSLIPRMAIERRKGCHFVPLKNGPPLLHSVGLVRLKRNHLSPAQALFAKELIASVSPSN